MKHHAEAAGLPHVTLEIRQDLIDTRRGARKWARIVAAALGPLLADPAVRRPHAAAAARAG
jgi:predicted N-formylglutamate amidohydrolase